MFTCIELLQINTIDWLRQILKLLNYFKIGYLDQGISLSLYDIDLYFCFHLLVLVVTEILSPKMLFIQQDFFLAF